MEAPLCTWDNETGILTTPQDNQTDGIMSDVCSLPFFQDGLAVPRAAEGSKSGRKKEHTAPKMCFKLGGNHSVQTIHGANNGKYTKTTKPGAEPGIGTQASTATPATANQPVIELDQTNSSSSKDEVMEKVVINPPPGHHPCQLLLMRMGKLANQPAADSPLCPPPMSPRGGAASTQASSGECEVAGSIWHQQNQQRACHFGNPCDTTRRIQLIDKFGTWQYIEQWG